jgi:hypothetical protein
MAIYSTYPIRIQGVVSYAASCIGGSQVFEKSVSPFKTLIPSCTHPFHAHSFRDVMCACFLQEKKIHVVLLRKDEDSTKAVTS